jgi:hypothetical protein
MKLASIWAWSTVAGSPERGGEKSQMMDVWPVASKQPSVIFTKAAPPVVFYGIVVWVR